MDAQATDFLGRLIAARSHSSLDKSIDVSNREAAGVVAEALEGFGMKVETVEVPGLADKHNVIAHAGPEMPGEGLLLAGHTDTVPCDPELWETDPFALEERDGCLRGLGTCDMKGFFAAVHIALREVGLSSLRRPLQVWATAEEECGMAGAMHAASTAPPCAAALVGEPTAVTPVRGHKGAIAERVLFSGKAGHGSDPASGANALEAAGLVMSALRADVAKRAEALADDSFVPAGPTVNFGYCRAGDAFNRIPDRAELWVERRLVVGETVEGARKELRDVAEAAAQGIDGVTVAFESFVKGFGPFLTDADAPVIRKAEELAGMKATTVSYGTEAPYYSAAGMDVLVMGAGEIGWAHKPDERVPVAEVDRMAEIACGLVRSFCVD